MDISELIFSEPLTFLEVFNLSYSLESEVQVSVAYISLDLYSLSDL